MRNHKARMQARFPREKRRQPFALVRINQAIGAAFADAHKIGQRDGGVIERESERRAVKISARDHITAFRKDERIIRGRRGFNQQNFFAMRERAAHRAVHLRHATDAVGVLHTRIVLAMGFANLASLQKRQQMSSGRFLSGMRTRILQTWIKCRGCIFKRFKGHRAGDIRDARQSFRAQDRQSPRRHAFPACR